MALTIDGSRRSLLAERVEVSVETDVGAARRCAARHARRLELSPDRVDAAALVATELATNLVRHSEGGSVLVQGRDERDAAEIELFAVDPGPGMTDPEACLRDGYSTSSGPGEGLGAIRRTATEMQLYSRRGVGTTVFARVSAPRADPRAIGALAFPHPHESVSGDAWWFARDGAWWRAAVVDGLGHGPDAKLAADEVLSVLDAEPTMDLVTVFERAGRALHRTRGAAVTLVERRPGQGELRWLGVGNVDASVIRDGRRRGMVVSHGIVGRGRSSTRLSTMDAAPEDYVVLHSDGLSARWEPDRLPGLFRRPAAVVAGTVFRAYDRGRDDSTLLVIPPLFEDA